MTIKFEVGTVFQTDCFNAGSGWMSENGAKNPFCDLLSVGANFGNIPLDMENRSKKYYLVIALPGVNGDRLMSCKELNDDLSWKNYSEVINIHPEAIEIIATDETTKALPNKMVKSAPFIWPSDATIIKPLPKVERQPTP